MSDPEKWIIDTNLIVHWLMVNQILQFSVRRFSLPIEFLDMYKNRYELSVSVVEKALETPKDKHDFVIVELSLSELFSGVRDEVRSILLFVKGVPISRWASKRETTEVRFSEELSEKIYELTSRGLDTLFGDNRIGIIPVTSPSDVENYFEVYSALVFLHPELKTQDAILVTTGIFEKINYFATLDRDLIRMGRELTEQYNLQVVSPQRALQILV